MTFTSNREAFESYAAEIYKLSEVILANLSVLMGMEKDGIRMNYYLSCSRPDVMCLVIVGISPHSDESTITFLIQDDETSGLQIRHNGGWVPVNPIPNAIVVNC